MIRTIGSFSYVWMDQLSDYYPDGIGLCPKDWNAWQESTDKAVWIIDSVEEGERIQKNVMQSALKTLRSGGKNIYDRLTVLIFCREQELPTNLLSGLRDIYRNRLSEVELLPLDHDSLDGFLSDQPSKPTLARVKAFIAANHLEHVAGIPAALEFICASLTKESLSEADVWKGVLCSLLKELNPCKNSVNNFSAEEMFESAARLAVLSSFSGATIGSNASYFENDLVPAALFPREMLRALEQTLRTGMFRTNRFAEKHVEQWMASFGLQKLRLSKLRPLICDSRNQLVTEHRWIASTLQKVSKESEVRLWLCEQEGIAPLAGDLATHSLEEVLPFIDKLERDVNDSDWHIWLSDHKDLSHLNCPGLGTELANRIRSKSRSAVCKDIMLQIAEANSCCEVLPVALDVVRTRKAPIRNRRSAAHFVFRVGDEEQLKVLGSYICSLKLVRLEENSIVAAIIERLLEKNLWSLEQAARYAPIPVGDVIDSTTMLSRHLREHMTKDVAIAIFRRYWRWLRSLVRRKDFPNSAQRGSSSRRRERELIIAAIQFLGTAQGTPIRVLRQMIFLEKHEDSLRQHFGQWCEVAPAIARCEPLRREEWMKAMNLPENAPGALPWYRVRGLLQPDDIDWLRDWLLRNSAKDERPWETLLELSRTFPRGHPTRKDCRTFVKGSAPNRLCNYVTRRRAVRQEIRNRQKKFAPSEEPEEQIFDIVTVVENALKRDSTPEARLMDLSASALMPKEWAFRNVRGTWDDIPSDLQRQILTTCAKCLDIVTPTEIPDGSTFPSSILYEAAAVLEIVRRAPELFELTGGRIAKWLPTVLFGGHFGESQEAFVAACQANDALATESAVLLALRGDLRRSTDGILIANYLPNEIWTDTFRKHVLELVQGKEFDDRAKAKLLSRLIARRDHGALELMRTLSEGITPGPLRQTALNHRMAFEPEAALPIVLEDYKRRGKQALIDTPGLYDDRSFPSCAELPTEALASLGAILLREFGSIPGRSKSGLVTPDLELTNFAGSIPWRLFRRGEDARKSLETMIAPFPKWKKWYRRQKAEDAARTTIEAAGSVLAFPRYSAPSPEDLADTLDNPDFRLIRGDDDLMDLCVELLGVIAGDIEYDLPLFYGKNRKVPEEILQIYILRRLSDLFRGHFCAGDVKVQLIPEARGKRKRRRDILVTAPTTFNSLASCVIEVKWSDSHDQRHNVSTALKGQLGRDYLCNEGKTCGIFLVGWTGKIGTWYKGGGDSPKKPVTMSALEKVLRRQAKEFACENKGVRIEPVLLPLEAPKVLSGAKKTSPRSAKR